jgi:hypothetical protein
VAFGGSNAATAAGNWAADAVLFVATGARACGVVDVSRVVTTAAAVPIVTVLVTAITSEATLEDVPVAASAALA